MRILVTGSSGFYGAHVCRALVAAGHDAFAGVRSRSPLWRLEALAPAATRVVVDVTDPATLEAAVSAVRPDWIVNSAGCGVNYGEQDFDAAYEINVHGALAVARAARHAGAGLIQIGTSYEYGSSPEPLSEDSACDPMGVYGVTKAAATLLVGEYARGAGLRTVILRLFSMYGPLEGGHKVVPSMMRAAREGGAIDLSLGEQQRDYVYVEDAAQAVAAAIEAPELPSGTIVNIASGSTITLRTLGEAAAGDGATLRWGARPYRSDELMKVVGHPARAAELLAWRARTSLADGMRQVQAFEQFRTDEA